MLPDRVYDSWIVGVLNQSLYAEERIPLGMNWQSRSHSSQISELGIKAGSALLILGEPGAGKTITLLEFAQDLIERTKLNEQEPPPVVLNLASWGSHQIRSKLSANPTLEEWLVEELNVLYEVNRQVGKALIENDDLALLLDGLDEIANKDKREACARAIQQFRNEHGATTLVVCSRVQEYEELSTSLSFSTLRIQPLTPEQIDVYLKTLEAKGKELAGLRTVLEIDPETQDAKNSLQELAKTPLFLWIMSLVYKGKSATEIREEGTTNPQENLFGNYISIRLHERYADYQYPKKKTSKWLNQLAVRWHNQDVFLIERMQPSDWLGWSWENSLYTLVSILLVAMPGLPFILVHGLKGAPLVLLMALMIGLFIAKESFFKDTRPADGSLSYSRISPKTLQRH